MSAEDGQGADSDPAAFEDDEASLFQRWNQLGQILKEDSRLLGRSMRNLMHFSTAERVP